MVIVQASCYLNIGQERYLESQIRYQDSLNSNEFLTKATWNLCKDCKRAFKNVKKTIFRGRFLFFLNFNKLLEIHTYFSQVQLGTVINQDNKPITFYSRNNILHMLILQPQKESYYPLQKFQKGQKYSLGSTNLSKCQNLQLTFNLLINLNLKIN